MAAQIQVVVTDTSGFYAFDPASLPQVLTYDANGNLHTVTVHFQGHTFVQTSGWTQATVAGAQVWQRTSLSGWVRQ